MEALAAVNFSFYVEYVHRGKYKHASHTEYICNKLEQLEQGKIERMMVFLPPRHGKSMTISETFPSYFIGRNPDRRAIVVSYGDALAKKFGRSNRRKIEEFGNDIFGVTVDDRNASVTNWGIKERDGGMISTGIGGPITGEGADLLIIDDPIKNMEEATSSTYRNKVWEEWQNTLLTRLHPGARVIIVLTRWHEDDLAGRLLKYDTEPWAVISIPAEAEPNDVLGRSIGEPLWPKHGYDMQWLQKKKKEVGTRTWNALYQQHPSPPEGGLIKRDWFQFYTQIPNPNHFDEIIQSWDMSFKETNSGSYVVGQVWGRIGADKYLLDQVRDRIGFTETITLVKTLSYKWPQAHAKLIEDKANGPAVISSLQREVSGLIPIEPYGSKEARVAAVSPDIEAGNVYIPDPSIAPWVHDFIEECVDFPNGMNDDQVDSMSQALYRFQIKENDEPIMLW